MMNTPCDAKGGLIHLALAPKGVPFCVWLDGPLPVDTPTHYIDINDHQAVVAAVRSKDVCVTCRGILKMALFLNEDEV